MAMNRDQVAEFQRALNRFFDRFVVGYQPLIVDGKVGQATIKRTRQAMYYCGYEQKNITDATAKKIFNSSPGAANVRTLRNRMAHPGSTKYTAEVAVKRGGKRRTKHKTAWKKAQNAKKPTDVVQFDGRDVPRWIWNHLNWARQNGWRGTVNSGVRTPAYSEHLCYQMCGRASCPGRCAGRSSNHNYVGVPNTGAVDVSDYLTFARLMTRSPFSPKLKNALPNDLVHFSATGHRACTTSSPCATVDLLAALG